MLAIISDNSENHPAWDSVRTSELWGGFWWTMYPVWGNDYSFMINAVLCPIQGSTFDVTLIANDGVFEDTLFRPDYIAVLDTLIVDFDAEPIAGRAPLHVFFQSECNVIPTMLTWDFGDGDSSNALNPDHIYTEIGEYTVKLEAEIPGFTDSFVVENYISVTDVHADFSADRLSLIHI